MVVGWSVSQRVLSDLHDIISVWIVYRARKKETDQDQEDESAKVREEIADNFICRRNCLQSDRHGKLISKPSMSIYNFQVF